MEIKAENDLGRTLAPARDEKASVEVHTRGG